MSYDIELADRVRVELADVAGVTERKMFGGLAFLIGGNMTVAARGEGGLMLRTDPSTSAGLVEMTPAEFVVMRGRQMPGWLVVASEALGSEDELRRWVQLALDYNATLLPKG